MSRRSSIDRRTVLKLSGGSLAGFAASGFAAGTDPETRRVNVGFHTREGRKAALDAASEVVHEFAFDALTLHVPENATDELERHPGVRYVENDRRWHALAERYPDGAKCICAREAHECGYCGDCSDVAIIDTGIDSDHPDLVENLGSGQAFVSCQSGNGNTCHEPWDDDNGHGTHVAGTVGAAQNDEGIVGVAPCTTLHALKVLDASGAGSSSDVAYAIQYTADQNWDVANLSLGGAHSSAVQDACEYAYDSGVLLVASAGNDGPCSDCVSYPAAYETVVAVGAVDCDGSLLEFSSQGDEVELVAPGSGIYSTIPGGYDTYSGTSVAAPHVSGVGALLMGCPDHLSNEQARERMCETADDVGLLDTQQGCGRVNAARAVGCSCDHDLL